MLKLLENIHNSQRRNQKPLVDPYFEHQAQQSAQLSGPVKIALVLGGLILSYYLLRTFVFTGKGVKLEDADLDVDLE